ncbi:MAG: molybdate ABC transporter substrate-binding protein [Hyphomicrobiales bacterium]
MKNLRDRVSLLASLAVLLLCLGSTNAAAEKARVATAANFTSTAEKLISAFQASHPDHEISLITGSTGKIFAQILHGAPFDIFLSADRQRPEELVKRDLVAQANRFTYASGLLALWTTDPSLNQDNLADVLKNGRFRKLAIANPELAPYGNAAMKLIYDLKLIEDVRERLVMGENVGQTYALVASGNAELGFIALSQTLDPNALGKGKIWKVPSNLHEPVAQDAVLLQRASNNPAALAFFEYLQSEDAKNIIRNAGYDVE